MNRYILFIQKTKDSDIEIVDIVKTLRSVKIKNKKLVRDFIDKLDYYSVGWDIEDKFIKIPHNVKLLKKFEESVDYIKIKKTIKEMVDNILNERLGEVKVFIVKNILGISDNTGSGTFHTFHNDINKSFYTNDTSQNEYSDIVNQILTVLKKEKPIMSKNEKVAYNIPFYSKQMNGQYHRLDVFSTSGIDSVKSSKDYYILISPFKKNYSIINFFDNKKELKSWINMD